MQFNGMLTEFLLIILAIIILIIIYYLTKTFRKPITAKSNYLLALESLADGNTKWALQKFKEAVREDTENIDAYLRLGDLLREKGLATHALKIHKDLTLRSNLSEEINTKIQHSLMLDYEILGNMNAAIEVANSLLEKGKTNIGEIVTKLLKYYEKERRWSDAFEAVKKNFRNPSVQMKRKSALYLVLEGLEIEKKNQARDARIKFREALKIDPNCSAAYYYLGKSYYLEDRVEDAIKEWQNFSEKLPGKAHIVFNILEKAWFDLGKFGEAEKLYKKIVAKDVENIFAIVALAEIYNKKAEFDNALEILDKVAEDKAVHPRIIGTRLLTLSNKNQYKIACGEAIEYFQKNHFLTSWYYVCQECQFESNEPLWVCPQCQNIASFEI